MKSINRVLLPQPIEAQAVALLEREICKVVIASDPKPETVKALIKGVQGVILRKCYRTRNLSDVGVV